MMGEAKMRRLIILMTVWVFLGNVSFISTAGAVDELVIVGTGSGVPLLKAVGTAFTARNPGITVTIPESIGSGGGIKAVGNDEYMLGRVAREINDREKTYGLTQVRLAKIPIVFFVNKNVPISGINAEQACGIYNGVIRKWEEICEGEGNIRVIKREDGDSSLMVLQETVSGFKDITLTPRSKTTYTDKENVEECGSIENSIAFGSWSDVKYEKSVRALDLEGKKPSDPGYPYIGFLDLIYKEKNYNGILKKFVEFISSDAAKKAIIEAGGLPVN
jgi:phosphate transport system substrate-binding protein